MWVYDIYSEEESQVSKIVRKELKKKGLKPTDEVARKLIEKEKDFTKLNELVEKEY